MNMASSLSLYSHTSLPDALNMPASIAKRFFEGKPFEDWKKMREAETKLQAGIANRLNSVIMACGSIVKTIAKTR